jgi:hypothetical protein
MFVPPRSVLVRIAAAIAWFTCCSQQLVGQAPGLAVGAVPGAVELRIDAAPAGAIVAAVIGAQRGHTPLPGLVLGVDAPELFGVTLADGNGIARLATAFPLDSRRGREFVAQAVALTSGGFAPSAVAASRVPAVHAPVHLVVLFGQSNAEGHAVDAGLPPSMRGPWPPCRMWNAFTGAFAALEHGVNTRAYGPATWCGPELTLARSLTADGRVVCLLKFAAPSSTLGPSPGAFDEWGIEAGELYAVLVDRLHAAAAVLRANGLAPRVTGVCMMQGESDTTTSALAHGYHVRLTRLVTGLRHDLRAAGLAGDEPAPFVLGRVHRNLPPASFPHVLEVQAAQAAVARELPRCALVDTNDLALEPDGLHFAAAAALTLGERFGAALRALR